MSIYRHQEVGPPNSRSQPAELLNEVYAVNYTKKNYTQQPQIFLKMGSENSDHENEDHGSSINAAIRRSGAPPWP